LNRPSKRGGRLVFSDMSENLVEDVVENLVEDLVEDLGERDRSGAIRHRAPSY